MEVLHKLLQKYINVFSVYKYSFGLFYIKSLWLIRRDFGGLFVNVWL